MPTKLIRSFYNITPKFQGAALTIGNFDGVHLGHQELIQHVIAKAKALNVPSMVITFEPHPFEFFKVHDTANHAIPRLTRFREKFYWLAKTGVDAVLILPFNQKLANKPASDFVTDYLANALKAKHIVVGDDFRFGHKRQGDFSLLKQLGNELGFSVEAMPTLKVDDERVSSTRVRAALASDQHELVRRLLGRPYSMQGRIRWGDQRGRVLGFPTANIFLHRTLTPVQGVYTVYVHNISDHPWPGVANVGVRPTVDGTRSLLEVHLLDFTQDIYGRYVEVEFCEKLRDEVRFPSLDLLKEQIAADVASAHNYFKKKGLGPRS